MRVLEFHVNAVHFESGGIIGTHPTGFCQLFLVAAGEGWAAGADGIKVQLAAGQGAFFCFLLTFVDGCVLFCLVTNVNRMADCT